MLALRWVVPVPVTVGIVLALTCQTATQVTLQLTTDVPCDRVGPIAIKAAAGISEPVQLVVGGGDTFAFGLRVRAATPRSQDFTLAERIDPTGLTGDVGWRLSIDPNGTLALEEIEAGSVVGVVTAAKAPLNAQWHRVAVSTNTVKGSTIYVDGAPVVSGGGTYPVNPAGWAPALPPHPFDIDEIVYAAFQ